MWWMIVSVSFAGGFYHPNDVAAASARFGEAQQALFEPFDALQSEARTLATSLQQYRVALDLLGEREPAGSRDRLHALEATYHRDADRIRRSADAVIAAVDEAFTEALDRALSAHPGATPCARTIAVGPAVPGFGAKSRANPACTGDDLNAALTAAVDADPALAARLPALLDVTWPAFTLDRAPIPATGGAPRHVDALALVERLGSDRLRAIDRADEAARTAIDAALEGDAPVDLDRLTELGRGVAAQTRARRAAFATPILDAAEAALAKAHKGEPAVGWCAQPIALGGCAGEPLGNPKIVDLAADKKVQKAVP